ncbi:hypothetical protein FAM09_12300 [Niastella caeni]|uniref:Lipoprotein n=1 Tax=Niastella caeni TaxID=2569763 RepID=A0A4S8HUK0_9BACT|nr:hypothetical protein [Niastella caeni]THU39287.1 hypothetical protein FAM09_12300 [Niastella caeni]
MKYKVLLPLLVSGVFFNACSKEDDKMNTPGDKILETYYPGSTMEINELAIYTSNGVISDPAVIQDFLDRNVSTETKNYFYVNQSSVNINANNTVLYFLEKNRVHINGTNMEIVAQKDSLMIVSEYTSTPVPENNSTCSALAGKVPEFSSYYDCPDGSCASYRRTYPIIKSGINYYIPMLTYASVTKDCAMAPIEIPAINIKNHSLQSKLVEGDSVLIQYAKLPLVKKTVSN